MSQAAFPPAVPRIANPTLPVRRGLVGPGHQSFVITARMLGPTALGGLVALAPNESARILAGTSA